MVFHYCTGPGQFVEKEKLEYVAHLTNYSKLFELRVGKFALSSLFFYVVCHNINRFTSVHFVTDRSTKFFSF